MAKSSKESRRDKLLSAMTPEVLGRARDIAVDVDGFDGSDGPTTVRLNRGNVAFSDALASEWNVSRARIIELCIEFTRQSVTRS
ncbi:hypothetical protein [Burkholderia sp. Ac-20365]|uniref:hypothetical protein n=1 Tax=Burkholderia sp. Ac-20365 TaxID=2703897 RepID=UPI00197C66E7|nr:hypothetical protein [Burkholderia sp. Ac-20365]MBN3761167.1 hypothetical protein [Burkholderia sp. Ac-20365]